MQKKYKKYREILQERLTDKRYNHSLCVADEAVRLAKKYLAATEEACSLRGLENLTCKDVFDAGAAGDPVALQILEQVYSFLGEFLANVCCVVDPEVVVLGGGVSKAGDVITRGIVKDFAPGDKVKYTIVIWLEGDDPDCVDRVIDGLAKLDMNFSVIH